MAWSYYVQNGARLKNRWKKNFFKTVGPVWVKLRKSVRFLSSPVFGVQSVSVGSFDGFAKDLQNEEIIDEFEIWGKRFFPP
jgi:hypothetical protein